MATVEPASAPAATPVLPSPRKHVAVVFFHGIGQQRKYETTASLIEALDDWVFINHRAANPQFPSPRLDIRTRCEVWRSDGPSDGATIVYQQVDYLKTRVRFYEGYWAPATVRGTSPLAAFAWLMRQMMRPIVVLRTPWRSYARLRRGDLLAWSIRAGRAEDPLVRRVVDLYREFVQQKNADAAAFGDFEQFIRKSRDEQDAGPLVDMAQRWRRSHIRRQLIYLAALALIGLTVASGMTLILIALFELLARASMIPGVTRVLSLELVQPSVKNAVSLLSVLASALGVTTFLRDYVGDIQQFVTYEEAQPLYERRQKILAMAVRTLKHVLRDEQCERVVIVGHSLGTAVALDAVLQLRGSNQAERPDASAGEVAKGPLRLSLIQHFMTCGSPIDKINYFFAALRSMSRSYESLIEGLRGDITSVPFSGGGRQPYVHWINFWDRGDPISGPIETLAGDLVRVQRVDNVEVCSYLWPDPAASHEGYLRHRDMIRAVFRAVFFDELSFAHCKPEKKGEPPKWPWVGPGSATWLQRVFLLLVPVTAMLLVWTTLAVLLPAYLTPPFTALGALTALLFVGAQLQRRFRLHRARVSVK